MIGFGSTERDFEEGEIAAFREFAQEAMKGDQIVSEETVADAERWMKKRGDDLRSQADAYKTATDYPDRYSYFHGSVASSASYIVGIFTFMHINRRHAFSPDGWALMKTERSEAVRSF